MLKTVEQFFYSIYNYLQSWCTGHILGNVYIEYGLVNQDDGKAKVNKILILLIDL